MSAHTEPNLKGGTLPYPPGNHIWAQRSLQFTINACSRISCHMGIMYYIYMKIRQRHHKTWMSLTPTLPKDNHHLHSKHTHAVYVLVRLRACVCACACVCLCIGLSGAHTQIENMFGSPFGMFSLSFPHLMLLICMQQVCRWRHLDANTHTYTHKSIHGHIRTGHTQIHTCKAHTHTHTKASTCTLTLAWRVSCFNTHLAKF